MTTTYTRQYWQNGSSGGTPITASALNHIEEGIEDAVEVAEDALGSAASAQATATTAAGEAEDASAAAARGIADAATADAKAVAAHAAANAAQEDATQALTDAAAAQLSADAAQDDATQALTDAATAQSKADTAFELALGVDGDAAAIALPRGLMGWAQRTTFEGTATANAKGGGPSQPFLRLDLELDAGRTYEISTSPLRVGVTSGASFQVILSYKEGQPATVYDRTYLATERLNADGSASHDGNSVGPLIGILPVPLDNEERKFSFLLEIVVLTPTTSSYQAGFRPLDNSPARIFVKDVGPYMEHTGINQRLHNDPVSWQER